MNFDTLFCYLEKECNFRKEDGKETWTCDGTLKSTKKFCERNSLDFEKVKERLGETGGYCDCEVLFNSINRIKCAERMSELTRRRNKLNRQISTLKKATLKT